MASFGGWVKSWKDGFFPDFAHAEASQERRLGSKAIGAASILFALIMSQSGFRVQSRGFGGFVLNLRINSFFWAPATAVAALVLASLFAAQAAEEESAPHTVVFEYSKTSTGQGVVEPLFILQDGKPLPLPFEGAGKRIASRLWTFSQKEYPPERVLRVFEGGRLLRGVIVDGGLDLAQPEEGPVIAGVNVRDAGVVLRGGEQALATNTAFPATLDFKRRRPNTAEMNEISAAARRIYAQAGLPEAVIASMKVEYAAVYDSADRGAGLLFASVTTTSFENAAPEHERALFLILDRAADGSFKVAHQQVTDGYGTKRKTEEIIDIFDIDGDGQPEAVTRTFYWESWEYNIRRRNGDTWDIIHTGVSNGP